MAVKRALFLTPRSAKRRRRQAIPMGLTIRKPEMKYFSGGISDTEIAGGTFSATELTAIPQGTDVDERIGNRIRIMRVEFRTSNASSEQLGWYLIQGHTQTAPVLADFANVVGGALTPANNNSNFTEWRFWNGTVFKDSPKIVQRFPKGYVAKYDGPNGADCTHNKLYLCYKHNYTIPATAYCGWRVWYIDE